MPPSETAILTRDLRKSFGDLQAVRGVDLEVQAGEIFSLLGPNGAGKSTIIAMLCCLLKPSGGEAWIMGHSVTNEPQQAKSMLGVVPQEIALYPDLSARENLVFWGKMYGLRGAALNRRVDEVLELIGLVDRQKGQVGTFSGGMKRRVNIGVALLHRPRVVIMDEPTVGIDPQSRRHILDSIKELNRQGMTVLYTTHYMEEAEELSRHIAIVDAGQVIARGTRAELVQMIGEQHRVEVSLGGEVERVVAAWRQLEGVTQVSLAEDKATLLATNGNALLPSLFETAAREGGRIASVEIQEPNLEAVFLHLTGRALRN